MMPNAIKLAIGLVMGFFIPASAYCDDPSPAFPLPNLDMHTEELQFVQDHLSAVVKNVTAMDEFNGTSFSLEVTSDKQTLFSMHHTAPVRNEKTPGTSKVGGTSLYRIASMTKPFTVLAILQQHAAGNLHIDDPVNKYIAELNEPQSGNLPWHDITLRALSSQIAGIPRDMAQQDLISEPKTAALFGLPPASSEDIPQCDSIVGYTRRCNASDLINWIQSREPIFAPNQKSSYSNLNYEILSLVIENVTGVPYTEYVQKHILDKLDMEYSTFDTPSESAMVIPAKNSYYWDFDQGIQKATGGLYSSTDDLSKFLRYTLTHYNGLTPVLNWFQPTSWSGTMQSFYGMPWEIFRTNSLVNSTRPITLITKGGGLPGYTSVMIMIPEYGFGMSILVAGDGKLLSYLRNAAVSAMIKYADNIAQQQLASRYAGTYLASASSNLNSSLTLTHDPKHGLVLKSLISNGTNTLNGLVAAIFPQGSSLDDFVLFLTPTLLYVDEKKQQGERWRVILLPKETKKNPTADGVWNNFCTTDVDFLSYAGLPVNEIVFWGGDEEKGEPALEAQLPAFRITLHRADRSRSAEAQTIIADREEL